MGPFDVGFEWARMTPAEQVWIPPQAGHTAPSRHCRLSRSTSALQHSPGLSQQHPTPPIPSCPLWKMTVILFTCSAGPAWIPSLILAWSFVDGGLFSAGAVLIQASWSSAPLRGRCCWGLCSIPRKQAWEMRLCTQRGAARELAKRALLLPSCCSPEWLPDYSIYIQ